jgi:CubicO group peptidase (beta-lactamase class C family)
VRGGEAIWSDAVGTASYEDGREATPDTQYRVGSITKTFTATAVMQLRDAGALDLDDRLQQHVPEVTEGSPTIRRLLAHLSGFQRETGEMWVTGEVPSMEEILAGMASYELVLPAARAHHYSNLAYALLGEVVSRHSGSAYTDYVDERIIVPLGLARTTWQPHDPYAQGYLVDEFAGTVRREPHTDPGGVAAMGQLWSTVGDLCAWAAFLAGGREGVLDASTVEEMWFPQVMVDPDRWDRGWGLGLELYNRDGRIFGGHGGAMPGHLAGVYVHRESGADTRDSARARVGHARAVAGRRRAVAAGGGSARRRAAAAWTLVVGGTRVRVHVGVGCAAGARDRCAGVDAAVGVRA